MHGPIRTAIARYALRAAAAVGAIYTLWLWWRMSERTDALYRGGFVLAALAVSAVIASVVQPDGSILKTALSFAPLRWIGRISYGLYLWHWPIYLWLTQARTGLDGTALLVLRLAVSVALAAASFVLVERPIRQRTSTCRKPKLVLVPAVTLASLTAIVRHDPGTVGTQIGRAGVRQRGDPQGRADGPGRCERRHHGWGARRRRGAVEGAPRRRLGRRLPRPRLPDPRAREQPRGVEPGDPRVWLAVEGIDPRGR